MLHRLPNPGEVWLVDFDFEDRQGSKVRPVVVVSLIRYPPRKQGRTGRDYIVVVPITSRVDECLHETDLFIEDWQEAGLDVPSCVKCRPRTILAGFLQQYLGHLSTNDWLTLRQKLRIALGL